MSLKEDRAKEVLVIGIGNPLRGDDGAGARIADQIKARGLIGVNVWITQQLNVEDLESMLDFKKIILVDASISGPPVDFRPVQKQLKGELASSHHLSAETYACLASSIYHTDLDIYVCSVKGEDFEVSDKLSFAMLKRVDRAVELICSFLKEKVYA